jgi:Uma2 family endonuclease
MVRSRAKRGVSNHLSSLGERSYIEKREAPMNIQLPLHIDKPAFLEWIQGREGRYELAKGRVVMMVGASRNHGINVGNLYSLIKAQLDPREWTVIAEFGLDTGPKTLRYPDIVVDRKGGRGGDFTAIAPVLLVEVLSPTTATYDLGDKAAEYLRLPNLSAYLVFAQDDAKAWVRVRGEASFSAAPDVVEGLDQSIRIPALNITLRLADVYANLETT